VAGENKIAAGISQRMVDYRISRFNKYTDGELLRMLLDLAKRSGASFVAARTFEQSTGVSETTISNHFACTRR